MRGETIMVNKTGLGSVVAGAIVLVATWHFFFSGQGAVPLAQSIADFVVSGLLVGGLAWLGISLVVLGTLILVI